jgi:hypothetical protein
MSDEQSGRGNSAILESAMLEEELRFAKKQQWNVAAAVVALLGAIFAIANATEDLQTWEQFVASLMAPLASGYRMLVALEAPKSLDFESIRRTAIRGIAGGTYSIHYWELC